MPQPAFTRMPVSATSVAVADAVSCARVAGHLSEPAPLMREYEFGRYPHVFESDVALGQPPDAHGVDFIGTDTGA